MPENMEQMKTFTVGADTWEIVDGAAREELADARTGADGTEYESAGEAMRESVNGINDDLEANYALQDGYYEMFTAGSADNLTGRGDGVGAEFIYRTAGGSADIADGVAKIQSVKGNTLVWNQLCNNQGITNTTGLTRTYGQNGAVTIDGTSTGNGIVALQSVHRDIGHKYLIKGCPANGSASTYALGLLGVPTDVGNGGIYTAASTGETTFALSVYDAGITFDNVTFYPQIFDLTRMFGAGNEPATVEEFEALYPESYYAYNAGSLLNVNMEGVRTVGFNECGFDIPYSVTPNNIEFDKTHAVRVIAGNQYEWTHEGVTGATTWRGAFVAFDMDGTRIRSSDKVTELVNLGYNSGSQYWVTSANGTAYRFRFTPQFNGYIMPFFGFGDTAETNTMVNPCIHLVWSGYRNGEYEEYWTQTREIDTAAYFPDGMKSAGSVYDELTAAKAIKRVGVVDLGTLTWLKSGSQFYADLPDAKLSQYATPANAICVKYPIIAMSAIDSSDKAIAINYGSHRVNVVDSDYTDAAAYKAAMSGVMLYYELAEPVETEISPELNLTYKVSDFGTEEIIVADNEQTAPVPMQIVYGLNAVDTIRRLPVEYISHKSFMQFISAIESHFNVTVTETYDSNNERYNYTIATNESGE